MNPTHLSRWSTIALMGGGVFIALFTSSHPASEAQPTAATQTQWILAHTFHWVGAFLLLFGLMGLGARLLPRTGRLGLVAFVMAFTGTAFFFAGGVVSAYIDPLLPVTALISSGSAPAPLVPYIAFVGVAAICLVWGWALIGVALKRAGLLAFAPAVALVVASIGFIGLGIMASVLPLLLVGLGTIPAGLLVFGWAERYAKRTGRLKRNG